MANDFKRMWTKEEVEKMAQGGGVTEEQFEELVRATPTDVSIIEDQGKLELMLEHDGNVLAVNDTPNQYLQRRLDKPSAEWDSETSSEDFMTWLQEKHESIYVGQMCYYELTDTSLYDRTIRCYGIILDKYYLSVDSMQPRIIKLNNIPYLLTKLSINSDVSTNAVVEGYSLSTGDRENEHTNVLSIEKFILF